MPFQPGMGSAHGTDSNPAREAARLRDRLAAAEAEAARAAAELEQRTRELEQRTCELDRSRARFQDVIERNPDAILVVDGEGLIRFANPRAAELFRTAREELVGTSFGFPMVAGETTELDLLHDGGARVIEMRVVESEWDREDACIASLRDVTERRQAEESARRLIREQVARSAAEAAARRFHFLAEASRLLSVPLDYEETLRILGRLCIDQIADWTIIYVVDEQGVVRRLDVAHRDPALGPAAQEMRDSPIEPGGPHPVLDVLRTRQPLLVTDVDEAKLASFAQDAGHLRQMQALGVSSFMLVPLVARGREIGAIGLVSASPARPFTPEDLDAATDLAVRAALAADNARLYRSAQEANQSKSNLLAVISHDLRTPLNSIMGHVELLAMGLPDQLSDATLQRVERIRLSAAHLVYLIDELLSFARLDGGHEELRVQELDARTIAHEVASVVEPLAQTRSITFDTELPDAPAPLNTDPDRLRQVLLNLLGNAIKYTDAGSVRLTLRTTADDDVCWEVTDTGVGIDPEHLDRIFEPFWQVDPTQRARNGGTGLGLSVVRRLVRLLGGTITVTSDVGRGSTFRVRLPQQLVSPPADP